MSAALRAFAFAGLAAIGGAARAEPARVDLEPKEGQGFVLLKVVSARQVSALNPKWKSIVLESKKTGGPTELYDRSDPGAAGSLFFGRLDEGDYEVVQLNSLGPGPGLLLAILAADAQDMRSRIGTVTVRAGTVNNLGTLVLAPESERGKVPAIEYLSGAIGRKSAADELERRSGRKLELPAQEGGIDPESEKRALARARAMISLISWGDDALGSGLFGGAPLGQIAAWSPGGRWKIDTLDTLDDVKYARRLKDGTLIAGLPQGRYAVRRPGQGWTYLRLPGTDAVIAYVDTTTDGGVLVFASDASRTMVLKRASLDRPEAETRAILTLDFPLHLRPNPVLSFDDALMVVENHPGISRVADITLIEKQSLQTKTLKVDFWIRSWQRMPGGEIMISRQNGMSYFTSVSSDRGATWSHREAPGPLSARFVDAKLGYGLNLTPGLFDVSLQLMKTVDGGKTWTEQGAPLRRNGTSGLLYAGDGEVVAAIGAQMYVTTDDGGTWTRAVLRGGD